MTAATRDTGFIPYGGDGTGHAGNDTSRERQEEDDSTGRAGRRRRDALARLGRASQTGMTAGEMENETGMGHGAVSSVLSHLHRAGLVSRLSERRSKMEVYVMPECVNGREESPYRPRQTLSARDIQQIRKRAMARGYREGFTAGVQESMKRQREPYTYELNSTNPYETEDKDHGDSDGT